MNSDTCGIVRSSVPEHGATTTATTLPIMQSRSRDALDTAEPGRADESPPPADIYEPFSLPNDAYRLDVPFQVSRAHACSLACADADPVPDIAGRRQRLRSTSSALDTKPPSPRAARYEQRVVSNNLPSLPRKRGLCAVTERLGRAQSFGRSASSCTRPTSAIVERCDRLFALLPGTRHSRQVHQQCLLQIRASGSVKATSKLLMMVTSLCPRMRQQHDRSARKAVYLLFRCRQTRAVASSSNQARKCSNYVAKRSPVSLLILL